MRIVGRLSDIKTKPCPPSSPLHSLSLTLTDSCFFATLRRSLPATLLRHLAVADGPGHHSTHRSLGSAPYILAASLLPAVIPLHPDWPGAVHPPTCRIAPSFAN